MLNIHMLVKCTCAMVIVYAVLDSAGLVRRSDGRRLQAQGPAHSLGIDDSSFWCNDATLGNDATTTCFFELPNDSFWELETTLRDGTVRTVTGDGTLDHDISILVYVGALLAITGSRLVAAFELRANECFDAACEMYTRSTTIQKVFVSFNGVAASIVINPDPDSFYLEDTFYVGEIGCNLEMAYYDGDYKIPLENGGKMPADTDLLTTLSCPELSASLVALLINSTVIPAIGAAKLVFGTPCHVGDTIHEINYGNDMQSFTVTQDVVRQKNGGDVVQQYYVGIVPREDVPFPFTSMRTNHTDKCHPEIESLAVLAHGHSAEDTRRNLNESPLIGNVGVAETIITVVDPAREPDSDVTCCAPITNMVATDTTGSAVFITALVCGTVVVLFALKYLTSNAASAPRASTTHEQPDLERASRAEDPNRHAKTAEDMRELSSLDVAVGTVGASP